MRALRVLGLADNGDSLICSDPVNGEQFSVPCDDRLRAAGRGDLSRFGQLEMEIESQMRPKEIQARIRAGASVEQVATLAGTTVSRVERYAYPVLLERSNMTGRARKARPAIDGISASVSVEETVTTTLAARGHAGELAWDSHRDESDWVLTLRWQVGRSENQARWTFHPGPAGGTLTARDEAAAEIVDPALRVQRPLRRVRIEGRGDGRIEHQAAVATGSHSPVDHFSGHPGAEDATNTTDFNLPGQSGEDGEPAIPQTIEWGIAVGGDTPMRSGGPDHRSSPRSADRALRVSESAERTQPASPTTVAEHGSGGFDLPSQAPVGPDHSAERAPAEQAAALAPNPAHSKGAPAKSARRGQRPAMPSWEDVLLGTRSSGH